MNQLEQVYPLPLYCLFMELIHICSFCANISFLYQRVTPWNAVKMSDAIIMNGPVKHPGAVKLASRNMRIAISRKLTSSRWAKR